MIKRPMLLVFMVAIVFGNMLTVKAQDDSKD